MPAVTENTPNEPVPAAVAVTACQVAAARLRMAAPSRVSIIACKAVMPEASPAAVCMAEPRPLTAGTMPEKAS